jgi:hypothetical protein
VDQNVQETAPTYDVFVSYCQKDSVPARLLMRTILELHPAARIFYDQKTIRPGHSWLMDLAESLDGARQVAALLTPDYWSSGICKDEFSAALTRQRDLKQPVLFPIYFRTAQIPYLFRTLQYVDCREADSAKLRIACAELCAAFTGSPLNSSG